MSEAEKFLKDNQGSARLTYSTGEEDRWLVYDKTPFSEWTVYSKVFRKQVKKIGEYSLFSDALHFLKDIK